MSKRRHRCTECRGFDHEVGPISRSGLCPGCGKERYRANLEAQRTQTGPLWEETQRRWVAACGAKGRPETAS